MYGFYIGIQIIEFKFQIVTLQLNQSIYHFYEIFSIYHFIFK